LFGYSFGVVLNHFASAESCPIVLLWFGEWNPLWHT